MISTNRAWDRRPAAWKVSLGLALLLAASVFTSTLIASDTAQEHPMIDTSFQQMFEFSKTEKRGLVLFVNGQTIAGLVVSYSDEAVEMRSQQFDRIVVRVDRIDGMAHQ